MDNDNLPRLHAAVVRGDSHSVAQLLELGVLVDERDAMEQTACHVAVRRQDERIVALLLRAGCNVNAVDAKDRTPCHLAVLGGSQSLVAMLLAAGAKVHRFRDWNQNTVDLANSDVLARTLMSARSNGAMDVINCERDSGRFALVRYRAFDICVGLHRLRLDALCMHHILQHGCGDDARQLPFHVLWSLAVTVKHFEKL
jgi:ankyrin repeat protein